MPIQPLQFRLATEQDATRLHRFVRTVFDRHVAPLFSIQGRHEFYHYNSVAFLKARLRSEDHFVVMALYGRVLAGMIEIRHHEHISLFFVRTSRQGQGIGKRLFTESLRVCHLQGKEPDRMTVNSSPNSVEVYRRLGFVPASEEQTKNGIRFTPMMAASLRDQIAQ